MDDLLDRNMTAREISELIAETLVAIKYGGTADTKCNAAARHLLARSLDQPRPKVQQAMREIADRLPKLAEGWGRTKTYTPPSSTQRGRD